MARALPRWLSSACLLFVAWGPMAVAADADFLDPERAFGLTVRAAGPHEVEVTFDVAPGYYLYRDQLGFDTPGSVLGTPRLPAAQSKYDETFQKTVETYRGQVRIVLPIQGSPTRLTLLVRNQGCADRGLCYPPQQRGFDLRATAGTAYDSIRPLTADQTEAAVATSARVSGVPAPASIRQPLVTEVATDRALQSGRPGAVVSVFFVAGLLLSLTPCLWPMFPILSSVIAGAGSVTRRRGFGLAASYSFGMASVYTALGIAAGLVGEGLSAALQTPWVLGAFATLLAAMSMSMFGFYEIQLPEAVRGRLTATSGRLAPGRFAGVFAMGGLSALLVSPCVVAPLAGALLYLGQTRDVVLGGSALFALAVGMSVPLLVLGASAGALLPRAGAWMDDVKGFFGWILLGVAVWTVQPLLPSSYGWVAWTALALCAACALAFSARRGAVLSVPRRTARRSLAVGLAAVGALYVAGSLSGATDPLRPWTAWRRGEPRADEVPLSFRTIRTTQELSTLLAQPDRPVVVDFYADWCIACKEMERDTLVDPRVRHRLETASLVRIDVTANTAEDRALLKRFQLFGPPGTLFFDREGREVTAARVVGYQNVQTFEETLDRAGL